MFASIENLILTCSPLTNQLTNLDAVFFFKEVLVFVNASSLKRHITIPVNDFYNLNENFCNNANLAATVLSTHHL